MILLRRRKSWGIMIWKMWSSSLICGGLILFPREIKVIPPPWIICLRIWPIGRLLKVVESVHLFYLSKNCHRWTILYLVHGTSTDRTTLNRKCVRHIDRFSYTQSIQPLHNGIHPLCQLCLSFQLKDAPSLRVSGRFILTTCEIPLL
jgi:hypothetical protein